MPRKNANAVGGVPLPIRRLHVELTNRCNFRCKFCADGVMTRPRGAMPLSMVDEILAQAGRGRIASQVHFHLMGEPVLYPGLPEAVRLARRHGMEAWVTTNGSILTRELLDALLAAGLSHLALGNWAGHFDLPIRTARFGYCPGIVENFGILWNGDYVICCTDYDGRTVSANFAGTPIRDWLALPEVQRVAEGFRRLRVVHPHCALCLGERRPLDSLFRQFGSICYHKIYRRFFRDDCEREAS